MIFFVIHRIDCTVDAQDTIECVVLSYPPVPANNFSWLLPDADRMIAGKCKPNPQPYISHSSERRHPSVSK